MARVPPDDPFAGCKVVNDGLERWQVDCPQMRLITRDLGPTFRTASKEFVEGPAVNGFIESAGGPVQRRDDVVDLDGIEAPAIHLAAAATDANAREVLVVRIDKQKGLRTVACYHPSGEDRCRAALASVARIELLVGPPRTTPRQSPRLEFAGQRYEPPEGCTGAPYGDGSIVRCVDQTVFMWTPLAPGTSFLSGTREDARAANMTVEHTVPCRIAGLAAHCSVFTGTAGDPRTLLYADIAIRGQVLGLYCLSFAPVPPFPAACSPMSFDPAPSE